MQSRQIRSVTTWAMRRAERTFIRHIPGKGYAVCYKNVPGKHQARMTTIYLPYFEEYGQAVEALQRRIAQRFV